MAKEVENPVHQQEGQFRPKPASGGACLSPRRLDRDHDITQQIRPGRSEAPLGHGKCQDIGRAGDAAVSPVQGRNGGVVHQENATLRSRACQRGQRFFPHLS